MAKLDLNEATREELVDVAGLRPMVAEAVLKVRDEQGGEIADIGALKDALSEVKGIGPATLEQLGDHLKVSRKPAKPAGEKPADAPPSAVKAGAEKATEAVASGVKVARQRAVETTEAARAGAEGARRTVERTAEITSLVTRGSVEAASRTVSGLADAEKAAVVRSSAAAGELSQLVAQLIQEQVQANVETLQALARARTWPEALEAQNAYFRGSIERMTTGTSRYVEMIARLTTGLSTGDGGKGNRSA